MFRFGEPIYLYLLLIIPLLVVFYVYTNYRRRKKLRQYGDPELMAHLMPNVSKYRPDVKFWLVTIALVMVIFMLARPQFGSKMETVKRQGVETVVALDISNSMMAEDVTPSRLEKSKKLVSRLVETFNNDKVAMIVFAGEAYTQLPITSDYISAKMFLVTISPSLITTQGTDIRGAIDLAMKSFTPNEGVGRAIVLITDGENHEGGAVEAAKSAAEHTAPFSFAGLLPGKQAGLQPFRHLPVALLVGVDTVHQQFPAHLAGRIQEIHGKVHAGDPRALGVLSQPCAVRLHLHSSPAEIHKAGPVFRRSRPVDG